uniref:DUF3741 domain-containing protein n=2 Tax=Oryza brachyantha TaxID=4533 RepID=J3KYG8_ORYBR
MYRASFSDCYDGMGLASSSGAGGGSGHRRASVCCAAGDGNGYEMDLERTLRMPATVAGESVVWCKPGVVAKLMGLDAVPVPVRGAVAQRRGAAGGRRKTSGPPPPASAITGGRKRRVRRTGREEEEGLPELEKERLFMALHGYDVAGLGACHAGDLHPSVGPNVSGMGRGGEDGWGFRFPL